MEVRFGLLKESFDLLEGGKAWIVGGFGLLEGTSGSGEGG